ncbi:MAG: MliC family protein [Thermovirgaceae bacterium]
MRKATGLAVLAAVFLAASVLGAAENQDKDMRFTYDFYGLTFDVEFVEDAAILYFPDGPLELPRAISGSGARYTDGETTFWIKGDDARLEFTGSVK